jgi:hypothetical protein
MDTQKDSRDFKIQEAITKGYKSICKGYKEEYYQALKAYSDPPKTLEDFEKAIGRIDKLVHEVHGVSDSCLSDVDIGLMVLYHGIRSKKEQSIINKKRKEMKNWPLPFSETKLAKALKTIKEAKERKHIADNAVEYYVGDGSD